MITNINLATQPYEDAKQYLAKWGLLLIVLFVATVALVSFTVHSVRRSSDVNRNLARMQSNMNRLDQEKTDAERMLAMPQNRGTVGKSLFLNETFARKAFSWTTVFSDMEKIMPPGLHVSAITPELDDQNQLQVHIQVGGENRERAIELVRKMEETPRFRDVQLRSDTTDLNPTGTTSNESRDLIKFDIVAHYLPGVPNASSEGAAQAAKPGNESADLTVAENGAKR